MFVAEDDRLEQEVAISTDVAAVMTGCKAGVVTLMKASEPSLIGISYTASAIVWSWPAVTL